MFFGHDWAGGWLYTGLAFDADNFHQCVEIMVFRISTQAISEIDKTFHNLNTDLARFKSINNLSHRLQIDFLSLSNSVSGRFSECRYCK